MRNDPFGHSALPAGLTREGRVKLIGEVAEALLAGKLPPGPAARFVGGALASWLSHGGRLEDCLQVKLRGSHMTPARIWEALIADERQPDPPGVGSVLSHTESE